MKKLFYIAVVASLCAISHAGVITRGRGFTSGGAAPASWTDTNNPMSTYMFDPTATNASGLVDDGVSTNYGTLIPSAVGGWVWGTESTNENGRLEHDITLDGVDDSASLVVSPEFTTQTVGTVCVWFKKSGASRHHTLFAANDGGDAASFFVLQPDTSDRFGAALFEGGNRKWQAYCSPVLTNDVWHHFAVTQAGVVPVFYVDGISRTVEYVIGSNFPGYWFSDVADIDQISIGSEVRTGTRQLYALGSIDDLRVYNRALTSGEVFSVFYWTPPTTNIPNAYPGGNIEERP